MQQGLVRRIGTGEQTRAWDENWLPRDEVRRPITCLQNDAPQMVADFIDVTTASWNVPMLQQFFLPMDIEVITSIPLSTRRMDDCWAWHFEKTGIFSVRSAYRMICNIKRTREAWIEGRATSSNHKEEERAWTSLWKVKVPSKIRVFLWRLAKQSIPTGDVRHRRHMAPDISCGICGQADSWRHSLLECNMARCVWALAPDGVTEHMERTTEPDAKQWLFSMIATLRQEDLTFCLVTLWAIWYAQRKAIHEDIFQIPLSTLHFVENFIRDLKIVETKKVLTPSERPKEQAKRWVAPEAGYVKINVDAAVRKNGNFGSVVAVCRNGDGAFMGASAQVIHGLSDPAILESIACREALALACDLSLKQIHVASDCLEVISGLEGENLGRFSSVLKEIKATVADVFTSVRFTHEKRSSNVEGHGLARSSAYLNTGRHVWLEHTPDAFCIPLILNDQ
jgi:ribonuclease HI